MKAQELRLPNLVDFEGMICQAGEINIFEDETLEERIEGIPLSEEWLIKLGFEVRELANYVTIDFTTYQKGKLIVNDANWVEYDDNNIDLGYDLKYVHQLQNLYFALTGEELTIKE